MTIKTGFAESVPVVLSTQHSEHLSLEEVRELVLPIIRRSIPETLFSDDIRLLINPARTFCHRRSPTVTAALPDAKLSPTPTAVMRPHGGGAFREKIPSKVDRSAAYMMRYLAKEYRCLRECLRVSVAGFLRHRQKTVVVVYRLQKEPPRLTNKDFAKISELADLTPAGIIRRLRLCRPIYAPSAAYGHFGRLRAKTR